MQKRPLAKYLSGIALAFLSTMALAQAPAKQDEPEISQESLKPVPVVHVYGHELDKGAYTIRAINTATGLGLSILETPQSISVVTQQQILDRSLENITDVVNTVTGLSAMERDSSRQSFSARGFAISNLQIDGVPTTWSSGYSAGETQASTVIFERIEVVRGASGLLTGAGNPSAAINMVRKHARSREVTGYAAVSVGRWNEKGVQGDLTAPLNEEGSIRARVAASYEQSESYVDLAEEQTTVLYAVLDADLSNQTLLSVGFSYQENSPTASTWGGLPSWYSDGSRTDWERSKTVGADWTTWASTNTNYFAQVVHRFTNGWTLEARYDRLENKGDLRLLYLSGTVDRETGLGLNSLTSRYDNIREQNNFSVQLMGSFRLFDREHELVVGALHSDQAFVATQYKNEAPESVGNFLAWDGSYPEPVWTDNTYVAKAHDTVETGVYSAARFSLTEPLKLIVGARYTNWETEGENWQGPFAYEHQGVATPYAGLVYEFGGHYSTYASYTEVFKPQSYRDRNGNRLDPISGANYEVGIKGEFYDGHLNTSAAIFRIEQDNVAQKDGSHLVPGTISQAYYPAAGVVSEGYELEVSGMLMEDWLVSLGWSQFEAEDAEGKLVNTNHPRKQLKLFTKYDFDGVLANLSIGGGVNWESENYTETTNPITGQPERLTQEAFALVNLMARYDFSGQLSAQLNIKNALDKTYYSQIGFYNQLAYGSPRDIELTLRYRF